VQAQRAARHNSPSRRQRGGRCSAGRAAGRAVCAKGQTAVASTPQLLGAHDVPTAPGDRDCRSPMARPAPDLLGSPFAAVADGGSDHGEAGTTCLAAGSPPSLARPITSAKAKLGLCSQDDFRYAQAPAPSQGPARARRPCRCDAVEPGRHSRYEATSACGGCARQPQGTRSQGGRRMLRWGAAFLGAAMAQRGRRRPEVMKQRTQWVEHPCGTMQRGWDAGYFLRRGREKVRTAFRVPVLAYHLRRVVPLGTMPRLLAARG